jgi:hypothetical protein
MLQSSEGLLSAAGPPGLANTLSALCIRHSAASKANFHFRAERF